MSEFRTTVHIPEFPFRIDHSTPVLMAGSCFTAHIGQQLRQRKFPVEINPFGTIYNPISLVRSLWPGPSGEAHDFFRHEGLWRHWDTHSDWAHSDLPVAQEALDRQRTATAAYLLSAKVLVLTLGTADVFYRQDNQVIVANCHKMPARLFGQQRLSVAEIVTTVKEMVEKIRVQNPDLQLVLTVSPVRHWRSGAVENQRSKSVLLLACADLCAQLPGAFYFPAYEIMMDDLRDYRFYASDMLHPSEVAVQYIWQKFESAFFTDATRDLNRQIEKIRAAAGHRPFNPDTTEHHSFQARQLEIIAGLESRYPALDFVEEKKALGGN